MVVVVSFDGCLFLPSCAFGVIEGSGQQNIELAKDSGDQFRGECQESPTEILASWVLEDAFSPMGSTWGVVLRKHLEPMSQRKKRHHYYPKLSN